MNQEYIDGLLALATAQARAVKIPVSQEIIQIGRAHV